MFAALCDRASASSMLTEVRPAHDQPAYDNAKIVVWVNDKAQPLVLDRDPRWRLFYADEVHRLYFNIAGGVAPRAVPARIRFIFIYFAAIAAIVFLLRHGVGLRPLPGLWYNGR